MPAQRLPWFKFWIGATAHAKVRVLDDATFRTWVELLDACSQQPRRGRFVSRAAAQAIVRRPMKHIVTLINGKLIDDTPDGLVMHDWDEWQRWRMGDSIDSETPSEDPPNDSRTTREYQRNGLAKDSGTPSEAPSNAAAIRVRAAAPASGEERREKREVDVEEDDKTPRPSLRSGQAPRGNRRVQGVIDAFRERGEQEPRLSQRDVAALKRSTAKPAEIVDAYLAVRDGDWGDPWMLKRLNLFEAVGWVNGYLASQPRAPAPTSLSVVPSGGPANAFCQACSDAGRRPHPPGHPSCVAAAFRESA
jgi:hypothetical protein